MIILIYIHTHTHTHIYKVPIEGNQDNLHHLIKLILYAQTCHQQLKSSVQMRSSLINKRICLNMYLGAGKHQVQAIVYTLDIAVRNQMMLKFLTSILLVGSLKPISKISCMGIIFQRGIMVVSLLKMLRTMGLGFNSSIFCTKYKCGERAYKTLVAMYKDFFSSV